MFKRHTRKGSNEYVIPASVAVYKGSAGLKDGMDVLILEGSNGTRAVRAISDQPVEGFTTAAGGVYRKFGQGKLKAGHPLVVYVDAQSVHWVASVDDFNATFDPPLDMPALPAAALKQQAHMDTLAGAQAGADEETAG